MNDDAELLHRYAEEGANDAFAELVRRHVNLVYSAALRQLNGDAHLAADATQLVFTDLARKAASLTGHRVLAGWLFTSTRFTTAKLVRGERRRHAREEAAHLMEELNRDPGGALDWARVRPVLDDVLGELGEADREAILLRFFEGRDFAGVGARLNVSDNTARMRVERALDKLRALLERRGVKSTTAALAVTLAHQAVVAAPAGLAASVTGAALAGGAAVGAIATAGSVAAWMNFMSITKLQIGIGSALAVAGATGYIVQANSQAALQAELATLRGQHTATVALEQENFQLARTVAEVAALQPDDAAGAALRVEASALQKRLQALAALPVARPVTARQSAVAGEVFEVRRLDRTPKPEFQARPMYPAELRKAGVEGKVVVEFVVDSTGAVQNAKAVSSSQIEFEAAAVEAVSQWKFQPGEKGGQAVNTQMQIPIVFTVAKPPGTSVTETRPAEVKSAASPSASAPGVPSRVVLSPFTVQTNGNAATSTPVATANPPAAKPIPPAPWF
ncbi:TonB family protein [Horticoccus sp. 23ND18S-11]|uniref:TonB family protein n=1 Tax=Horticoccus sp. 23ND18S-11 TaxID=3391832 RepID=UPI0039C8EDE3